LLDLHFFSPSLLGSDSAAFKTGLGGRRGFAGRDGEEVRRCGGGGVTVLGLNFEACDEAVVDGGVRGGGGVGGGKPARMEEASAAQGRTPRP
jgi:hypothetical protein